MQSCKVECSAALIAILRINNLENLCLFNYPEIIKMLV